MNSKRAVRVGNIIIGGDAEVSVQSMYDSTLKAQDPALITERVNSLASLGCDIMRFSFIDQDDAEPFSYIAKHSVIPLVADIHFDYKMAMLALKSGAAKVRINPGNIGAWWKTEEVVKAAKDNGAAIRIGLNSGSLPKASASSDASKIMVESALKYIDGFEKLNFYDTVVSLKSSDVDTTLSAYREFAGLSDYPLHLGVTEAGTAVQASVRSAWALGTLLSQGIGDTLRVSITGSLEDEVIAGSEILRTLGLKKSGVKLISCPRCGRHSFDTALFLKRVENRLRAINKDITVAIMGCSVNGPGEARGADIAITGMGKRAYLYKKGKLFKEVDINSAEDLLFDVISSYDDVK